MIKQNEPDQTLIKMPSLRAVKAFVAAARYQNFTRAAEALCVTQGAISRQIRELEVHLGTELFERAGRAVKLTDAGSNFYDVVQLSFTSIAQAAERMRSNTTSKHVVTLCCSPAFTNFWLGPRLPSFFESYPEIDLNLVVTQNFLSMESGVHPDFIICKMMKSHDGYHSQPLVCDVIYPVCTPQYLEQHPELQSIQDLRDGALLNLSPFGRSQVAEHVDWNVWFAHHDIDLKARPSHAPHFFNANDYNVLIQLALAHQGVALGWHYLVAPLIEKGLLIRPVKEKLVHRETLHYLNSNEDKARDPSCCKLRDWLEEQFGSGLRQDPDDSNA
ncbi:DNA-binding transcriptional regulator, LysR family [Pseudomonas grimontii]|uniref:DNA-binding transcriptional regulator, LysR family n=1 Tax=Pseudomonas grimontii TaxID=129847 RepID=A0A1H1HFE5_9PSED|nr:LysR family transcriptional regulator [Pseudomonas grimontii]TWR63955.1 LysR family transcriptional regulator [Pseudomonas grimontii]SDR23828.1 DNA-binding transcriptional regulator, LysR family [Pseudomonas grimontii]